MTAFAPGTASLLRDSLHQVQKQRAADEKRLARQSKRSKSQMSNALRERLAWAMDTIRDLERLIALVEDTNAAARAAAWADVSWIDNDTESEASL